MSSSDIHAGISHIPADDDTHRRLDAAERVANALVHEIRNILNPIVSAAYLLNANADDPAKVRDLAGRIENFAKAESRVLVKKAELLAREAQEIHAAASPASSDISSQ